MAVSIRCEKMKNDPPLYIIFPYRSRRSRLAHAPTTRPGPRFARARRRATPPRLAGDLGGLEAAKRHGHATRRFPRSPTTTRCTASTILFFSTFTYGRIVADLVSTGQTEKL